MKSLPLFAKHLGVEAPATIMIGQNYYSVPKNVEMIRTVIPLQPESAGLFLGTIEGQDFKTSIGLLELCKKTEKKITVTPKAEWLFLCGRDIFATQVIDSTEDSPFIVANQEGEVLGLGKWNLSEGRKIVHPILDRGDFLRREKRRKY